jgi:glutamate transport system permease protein
VTAPLLADALGPKARRRVAIVSVVAGAALVALGAAAVSRFGARGQLEADRWSYFFKPEVLRFLGVGLLTTLRLAAVSMAVALAAGFLLALARLSRARPVRWTAATWIELFRGLPLVLLILSTYFGSLRLGLELSAFTAAAVALALYNSAILAEIFRAGILSLDRGQREAALVVGLTEGQAMRAVILPQAVRRMVPALISQLVTLLKDTSLAAAIIPLEELLRRFQLAAGGLVPSAELQGYLLAAAVYVTICLALSQLARRLEIRQRRRYRAGGIAVTGVEDLTVLDAVAGRRGVVSTP